HGDDQCYPTTDLFHLITAGPTHLSALLTIYPREAAAGARDVEYTIMDVPWQTVNIARFQIDHVLSNAYTTAGGRAPPPLDPSMLAAIRQAQELSVFMPIRHVVPVPDGTLVERFSMTPYTTLLYWITPFRPDAPAAPGWIRADPDGSNMVICWE